MAEKIVDRRFRQQIFAIVFKPRRHQNDCNKLCPFSLRHFPDDSLPFIYLGVLLLIPANSWGWRAVWRDHLATGERRYPRPGFRLEHWNQTHGLRCAQTLAKTRLLWLLDLWYVPNPNFDYVPNSSLLRPAALDHKLLFGTHLLFLLFIVDKATFLMLIWRFNVVRIFLIIRGSLSWSSSRV